MNKQKLKNIFFLIILAGLAGIGTKIAAGDILSGFDTTLLPSSDDGSWSVNLGDTGYSDPITFGNASYTSLYINNNGNLTFDNPFSAFTPTSISNIKMIAPFWADVDTRPSGGGTVSYGTSSYDGHTAFGVTWSSVGYYNSHTDLTNTFQVLLIDRTDRALGDFDILFNYGTIGWETGDASGGSGGFGGAAPLAGWSFGDGTNYQLLSGVGTGFSGSDGILFSFSGGAPTNVPEIPAGLVPFILLALSGLAFRIKEFLRK